MKTTYFGLSGTKSIAQLLDMRDRGISIAGETPCDFKGKRVYKKLAPKRWFHDKYKKDGNQAFYTKQYYTEVLDKLDAATVYKELGDDAILVCYEPPGEFCHRHLVAKWFKDELGIDVKEVEIENRHTDGVR